MEMIGFSVTSYGRSLLKEFFLSERCVRKAAMAGDECELRLRRVYVSSFLSFLLLEKTRRLPYRKATDVFFPRTVPQAAEFLARTSQVQAKAMFPCFGVPMPTCAQLRADF